MNGGYSTVHKMMVARAAESNLVVSEQSMDINLP